MNDVSDPHAHRRDRRTRPDPGRHPARPRSARSRRRDRRGDRHRDLRFGPALLDGDYPLFEPVALGHEAVGTVVETGRRRAHRRGGRPGAGVLGRRLRHLRRLRHPRPDHLSVRSADLRVGRPRWRAVRSAGGACRRLPAAAHPGRHRHRRSAAADRQSGHRMGRRAARRHSARRHRRRARPRCGRPVRGAQCDRAGCRQGLRRRPGRGSPGPRRARFGASPLEPPALGAVLEVTGGAVRRR